MLGKNLKKNIKKCLEDDQDCWEEDVNVEYFQTQHQIINYPTDLIEVQAINDIYKIVKIKDKESGETFEQQKLFKRNCITKETLYKYDVSSIKQLLNEKGLPYKTKLQIETKSGDKIVIKGCYNKYKEKIFNIPKNNKIGFI
jgi:hypothetical protein